MNNFKSHETHHKTLHIICQLLHVSALRCHHQRIYQEQSSYVQNIFQALVNITVIIKLTYQLVYIHIVVTSPHSDEPAWLHIRRRLYFLGCAHRHPYQYMIQRYLLRLKRGRPASEIHVGSTNLCC